MSRKASIEGKMGEESSAKSHAEACIRCASCTAVCPVSRVTPRFPGPKQAGPGAERFRWSDSPSLEDWIDLCIGCHLCEGVCAAGVNISELILIAKGKHLDEKGRPIRDWILSHSYLLGNLGSFLSRLLNPLFRNPFVSRVLEIFLKIDRRRKIPDFERLTFRKWFRHHSFKSEKRVAYFYGCYTNTNEADVNRATVEVLEANGLEVVVPPQKCCGIPLLGNGDFKGARKLALWNVPSLLRSVRSGLDIVFSSTSCGYMIKHEYDRLLHVPGSQEVAEHTFDVFEFLRNLKESGTLALRFKPLPLKAAYFAPCHLKALGIGFPAYEILQLIPQLRIDYIEADCCGLGGTFGFKKETFEVSEQIGKYLAEAIDRLKPEVLLSDCEGCRMQIRQLTGLNVLHPIQIVRDALVNPAP